MWKMAVEAASLFWILPWIKSNKYCRKSKNTQPFLKSRGFSNLCPLRCGCLCGAGQRELWGLDVGLCPGEWPQLGLCVQTSSVHPSPLQGWAPWGVPGPVGEQGVPLLWGLQSLQPSWTLAVVFPTSALPPEGFQTMLAWLKRLHVLYRDRYFEKQDIDASVEPLYWLIHLLADVAPFLLFVLRMDFYCLILCKWSASKL